MAKQKSMSRMITESIQEQESILAPMVDDLGIEAPAMLAPASIVFSEEDPFAEELVDEVGPEAIELIGEGSGEEVDVDVDVEPELEPEPEIPEDPEEEPELPKEVGDGEIDTEYDDDISVEYPWPMDDDDEDEDIGGGELDVPQDYEDEAAELDDLEEQELTERNKWTVAKLKDRHGGMSQPSKMPCATFSALAGAIPGERAEELGAEIKGLPAGFEKVRGTCPVGGKLASIPGSVCYGCYAAAGRYGFKNVIKSMIGRAAKLRYGLSTPGRLKIWIEAMCESIDRDGNKWFRWHDSGDILGPAHFDAVVEIARKRPKVRFWLPTKEHGTVNRWLAKYGEGELPGNLNVRLSALMLFDRIVASEPFTTSSVASGEGRKCPATYDHAGKHGAKCDGADGFKCRMCWNRSVTNIDYAYHGATYRFRHGLLVHGLQEPEKKKGVFQPPKKPELWTPAEPKQVQSWLKKGELKLPRAPRQVTKIVRPDYLPD